MSPIGPALVLERDESAVEGRAERSGVTYYCVPGCQMIGVTTFAVIADRAYYGVWAARSPIMVDQLAFEVSITGTATNARVGLYRADRDWQPIGAPLADSGDVGVSTTGVKTYTPSTPISVRPGRYVSALVTNGTVTLRAFQSGSFVAVLDTISSSPFVAGFRAVHTYGALPTPGPAWTEITNTSTSIGYQLVVFRLSMP